MHTCICVHHDLRLDQFFLAVSVGVIKFLKTRHYAMIGLFLKQNTLNPVSESPASDDIRCQLSCTRQDCL